MITKSYPELFDDDRSLRQDFPISSKFIDVLSLDLNTKGMSLFTDNVMRRFFLVSSCLYIRFLSTYFSFFWCLVISPFLITKEGATPSEAIISPSVPPTAGECADTTTSAMSCFALSRAPLIIPLLSVGNKSGPKMS